MPGELTEHNLDGLEIAGRTYGVTGMAPEGASTYQDPDGTVMRFAAHVDLVGRELGGALVYRPGGNLRVLVFSTEQIDGERRRLMDPERLSEDELLVDLGSPATGPEVLARLHERARDRQLLLKMTLLEIAADAPPDDDFAEMNVLTGGLPPLVLMSSAGFSFPVRSGLPGGVLPEWFTEAQQLEWQVGDSVFCHTDLPGEQSGATLRAFHDSLRENATDASYPADMLLLRVQFVA